MLTAIKERLTEGGEGSLRSDNLSKQEKCVRSVPSLIGSSEQRQVTENQRMRKKGDADECERIANAR